MDCGGPRYVPAMQNRMQVVRTKTLATAEKMHREYIT